jgi:hypothetical protein
MAVLVMVVVSSGGRKNDYSMKAEMGRKPATKAPCLEIP